MAAETTIYLDHNATTPVDPRVFDAMRPYFQEKFGNASSRHHARGCAAATAVERARLQVASLIGSDPREIVFTSGATEAINLAIMGIFESDAYRDKDRHIVTIRTEHRAVLDTCARLEQEGCTVTYLPVDQDGLLDLGHLDDTINGRTLLVAVMHANNETGVLLPIEKIARICRSKGVLFFTDATQSVGKETVNVEECGIDLLALSAHKIYGPQGVGALYVRRRPRVRCEAQLHGGGHERGLRSGTLNVPGIVGLGCAAAICEESLAQEQQRIAALRHELERGLLSQIEGLSCNGSADCRLANTLNATFAGVDGDALMRAMPDIAVSASSACTSAALQPSYVLGAMGRSDDDIAGSIRFSLGRFTTDDEIHHVIHRVVEEVTKQRTAAGSSSCSAGYDN